MGLVVLLSDFQRRTRAPARGTGAETAVVSRVSDYAESSRRVRAAGVAGSPCLRRGAQRGLPGHGLLCPPAAQAVAFVVVQQGRSASSWAGAFAATRKGTHERSRRRS